MFSGEADKHCQSMRNIPLVVLAAGKKPIIRARSTNEVVTIAREELLRLSNNHKFIIAEQSGHYIQKDEPHYIIDAVKWIIEVGRDINMYTLFQYNWQVRDDWFKWCEQLSAEELVRKRVGGVGSILETLFHIVDVEYS